MVFLKIV